VTSEPGSHERHKALFLAVCELPDAAAQDAALREAGASDADRAAVMELLGNQGASTHFSAPVAAAAVRLLGGELKSGDRVGAWTLQGELGRGGMGRVFLAARSDGHYEQQAALKLLLGWSGPQALAQLARERQILAKLQHPHISRLLDGGTTPGGQPYLVMEYAAGQAIDTWCAARQLGLEGRLSLMQMVCEAVAYAHRQLVIHCDIKPGNVLIDDHGHAMLLDFGIARLEGGGPEDNPASPAMTPGFASPEQKAGEPPGMASDIYSLGRLLAELLKPLPDPQPRRHELDAIVARATHPQPSQRYDSVAALQSDLRRLLAHQPLDALPHSPAYLLRKLLRRRWPWALAGSAAVLLAALFTLRVVHERDLALAAQAQARLAAEQAEQARALARLAETQARSGEARALAAEAEALRQRDLARGAQAQADRNRERAQQESRRAELEAATAQQTARMVMAWFTGADPKVIPVPTAPVSIPYDKGADRLKQELARNSAMSGRLNVVLGDTLDRISRLGEAAQAFERAAEIFASEEVALPLAEADALRRQALALSNHGLPERAEAPARRALALTLKHNPGDLQALADVENRLAIVLTALRRDDEASRLLEQAYARRVKGLGSDHPNTASTLHNLARLNQRMGHLALAESQFRSSIAAKRRRLTAIDDRTLNGLESLGGLLIEMQRHKDAEQTLREVAQGWTTVFGASNRRALVARKRLAQALLGAGRLDAALAELQATVRLEAAVTNTSAGDHAASHQIAASAQAAAGRLALAEQSWRAALARRAAGPGDSPAARAPAQQGLAHTLWLAGRADEAQAALAPVLVLVAPLPPDRVERLQAQLLAGEIALAQGRADEAATLLASLDRDMPAQRPGLRAQLLALRGHAARQAGQPADAARWLAAAWQAELAWRQLPHPSLLPLGLELHAALLGSGQAAAAQALRPKLEACAAEHAPESPWRQQLVAQLGTAPQPADAPTTQGK